MTPAQISDSIPVTNMAVRPSKNTSISIGGLSSMAYILMFAAERAFGFISVVTLVELADINAPLLSRLVAAVCYVEVFCQSCPVVLANEVADYLGQSSTP